MAISQTTVGWLLLGAAALTFVVGFASRTFIGRRRDTKAVRSLVRTFRKTGVARGLFGRFEVIIHGVSLDLSALKPRVRTLLRLLAVQGGRPLHREVIVAALWPEADADSGARNLHVAVSSLRQTLEPGALAAARQRQGQQCEQNEAKS